MAETLREQQFALASHLRDPDANPPPAGVEERRLAVYRTLFYNSIEGLLAGNFPVLKQTLGESDWHALVRRFYADFRCGTPLFTEIGSEFVRYLQERASRFDDPPWWPELAHYEWVELALQIAEDALPKHDPDGDLLAGMPLLSPLAWALAYHWPVHRIGPHHLPGVAHELPTLLLVRRDPAGDVHFSELSPLVYRLIELLGDGTIASGETALRALAMEAGAADVDTFVRDGRAMLERLHAEGTILGTLPQQERRGLMLC